MDFRIFMKECHDEQIDLKYAHRDRDKPDYDPYNDKEMMDRMDGWNPGRSMSTFESKEFKENQNKLRG